MTSGLCIKNILILALKVWAVLWFLCQNSQFSKFVTLWPWPWDENEKSSSMGLCRCHWANQIPEPLPDSTNPLGEDANWNRLPPKNTFFGRGSAHNGRSTPILRKTQLDHDTNLPPKFYQDRIKTHGAMLGTDRQTDRQAGRRTWVVDYPI